MGNDCIGMHERFAIYRKALSVSQKDLGQRYGMSQSQYSKCESGKIELTNDVLTDLYLLGWDIDYIISGTNENNEIKSLRSDLVKFDESQEKAVWELIYWYFGNYGGSNNLELKVLTLEHIQPIHMQMIILPEYYYFQGIVFDLVIV